MGPTEIGGLPAHILLVHLAVVIVPLAAALTVLSAVWPAARRKLGVVTPVVAAIGLVVVPVTVHAGEWLEARVTPSPLIARHVRLGHELLPWAVALFVVAVGQWVWFRSRPATSADATAAGAPTDPPPPTGLGSGTATATAPARTATAATPKTGPGKAVAVNVAIAVLAVVVGLGSVVQVYRVGESGSKAVWTGSFSPTPHNGG